MRVGTHLSVAKWSLALTLLVASLGTTAACGGEPSPYCQAVEKGSSSLDSFGSKKTDAGYASYAKVISSIAAKAPQPIDAQWTSLGRAVQGVVDAHQDIGFPLEDMGDDGKLADLSAGDAEVLNKAYERFNKTKPQRAKVVADASKSCDITLK